MEIAEKYEVCLDGLKEYAAGAGFTDMLVGLSGGIDSSVVAAMCVDAFGAERVHGVLMPGPYSSDHSVDDSVELAKNLGIATKTISICEPFEAFERVMATPCGGALDGLAAENTQARCRMVVLMALSNKYNWMLVNTGNKSEAYMGYSTLYGDTAGAYAPMGCLYKTDVFAVARYLNRRAEAAGQVPPIPAHVLTKPPSAELSPDQEDEKSMGASYDVIDRILMAHFEKGLAPEEIASGAHGADADGADGACADRANGADADGASGAYDNSASAACSDSASASDGNASASAGNASGAAEDELALDLVQRIINTANHYAFKRAMEPPCPQVAIYS